MHAGIVAEEAKRIMAHVYEVCAQVGQSADEVLQALIKFMSPPLQDMNEAMMKLIELSQEDEGWNNIDRQPTHNTPYRQWTSFIIIRNTRYYRRGAYV